MKKIPVFAAALALSFAALSFAGPAGPMDGVNDIMLEKNVMKFLDELGLDDSQKDKLRDIHGKNKRDIMKLRHEIQLAVFDIQEEYKKEKSDAAKIDSLINRISDAQKKLMKIRSAEMLKMKTVLTPAQFKKLSDKMDRAKAKVKKGLFDRPGKKVK